MLCGPEEAVFFVAQQMKAQDGRFLRLVILGI
jgi:hypothetical protein